jgi:general secretion pathway protein G
MVRLWKKGFTIIELLIVITVIAILIGIALPRFRGIQEEGNGAKARGEMRTLQTAIESYNMHKGSLPTALGDLILATTKPNIVGSALPTDPFKSGSNYVYSQSPSKMYYTVSSVGPGGSDTATVDDTGKVTLSSTDVIYASNGTK